jgi:hypothetical protein
MEQRGHVGLVSRILLDNRYIHIKQTDTGALYAASPSASIVVSPHLYRAYTTSAFMSVRRRCRGTLPRSSNGDSCIVGSPILLETHIRNVIDCLQIAHTYLEPVGSCMLASWVIRKPSKARTADGPISTRGVPKAVYFTATEGHHVKRSSCSAVFISSRPAESPLNLPICLLPGPLASAAFFLG